MLKNLSQVVRRQEGATAIEYALIAGVLALIIVAAFLLLGTGYQTALNNVIGEMVSPGT